MRVTLEQSELMQSQMKGLRIFKGTPGKIHRIIFPVDENDQFYLYAVPQHRYNLGSQARGRARCLKKFELRDENGNLKLDPATGKPINDGTCPYCELLDLYYKVASARMKKFDDENPNASEKERKEFYKRFIQKTPVSKPELMRGFLVGEIMMDESGKPVMVDGKPLVELKFLTMTPNQYEVKFKSVLSIVGSDYKWMEVLFTYPKGEPMESNKNMTMQYAPKQLVNEYPSIKEDLIAKIKELYPNGAPENALVDPVEEMIFSFRPESVIDVRRKLAGQFSRLSEELPQEDKEKIADEIDKSIPKIDEASIDDVMKTLEYNDSSNNSIDGLEIDVGF